MLRQISALKFFRGEEVQVILQESEEVITGKRRSSVCVL